MIKQIRYVHTVNPVTGKPCTIRIVVMSKDVTLWQVDQTVNSEKEFDLIDTEDVGMVSMPHEAFREVMKELVMAYTSLTGASTIRGVVEAYAEQEALAAQGIADEEAEAKAKVEYEHDQDEKSRHMEDGGSREHDEHEEGEA